MLNFHDNKQRPEPSGVTLCKPERIPTHNRLDVDEVDPDQLTLEITSVTIHHVGQYAPVTYLTPQEYRNRLKNEES